MSDWYRPDPIDGAARTLVSLVGVVVVLLGVGGVLVLARGTDLPVSAVPVEVLALPMAFGVVFLVLTTYHYRRSHLGDPGDPFPMFLPAPWEQLARFAGVIFLLYVSVAGVAFLVVAVQILRIPGLAAVADAAEPLALPVGPVLLFGYLVIWYARRVPD